MKEFKFPQPNGSVLVLTPSATTPNCYDTRYEDGSTISDRIREMFQAGEIRK